MRWTNTFPHPGDNRYHVFVFNTAELAAEFEERLTAANIPFETGRENEEWLFGVHRDHLQKAQHENHMLHAAHRTPFIPVEGLRWGLLIGTLAVILLALTGALLSQASGQTNSPYRLILLGGFQFPLEAVGAEPIITTAGPLEIAWTPTGGSGFGLRIERSLNEAWQVQTGLEVVRNWSDWQLTFSPTLPNDGIEMFAQDTLRLRSVRYRIPMIATTSVPITTDWALRAGIGLSLDMLPTDVFTTGSQQRDSLYSDFAAAENRQRWWALPLQAELFVQHTPRAWQGRRDGDLAAISLGVRWWQEFLRNKWGEGVWQHETVVADARFWMGTTSFAVEARLHLK